MKRVSVLSCVLGLCVIAGACSSTPAPTERMASAESALRAARELGADQVPRAQLHLQLAQEEIGRARKLMKDGENQRADYVLQRASADAELGVALARHESARRGAVETDMEAGGGQW